MKERKKGNRKKNPDCMKIEVLTTVILGNVVWFIMILGDGFEAQVN